MKLFLPVLAVATLSTFLLMPSAQAQSVRVSVKADLTEVNAAESSKAEKAEEEKMAGSGKEKKRPPQIDIDVTKLDLTLRSSSGAADGLTVKWWLVGREGGESGLQIIKEGTLEASVPAGEALKLSTEEVETKYIGAHRAKKERVDASGEKISGYGVQVLQGDKVVGDAFSSPDVEKLVIPD